jgi:hypothetical protein
MNNYANAQNLASYGRGNDTQLVHMTPGEVKGLQALALAHGGSLTINPETGLTEAGFLEKILPMVAGAGLMMIPGVGPLMAAGIVGGGYGLATGSVEKGLMAGLGAYGGAGLAGSLSSLGGQAAAEAAQQTAVEGFKETAAEAAKSSLGEAATANLQSLNPSVTSGEFAREMGTSGFNMPAGGLPSTQSVNADVAQRLLDDPNKFKGLTPETLQGYRGALNAPGANPQDVIGAAGRAQGASGATMSSNITRGLKEVGTSLPAAGDFAASNVGTIASAALPLLAADQQAAGPAGYQEDEYDRRLKGYRLSPDYQAYVAPRPNPYYRPTYAAEGGVMESFDDEAGTDTVGMASGGIARYRSKGQVNVLQDYIDRQDREEAQKQKHLSTNVSSYMPDVGIFRDPDIDTARKDALTASMIKLGKAGKGAGIKSTPLPKTSIKGLGDVRGATPEIEEAADGGVMRYNLGGYSDGGRMLKGPGDGMSDSIPASIAGKQPARLADGEFVVPADVVSHLGNGSTDAGAKKLYGMMDKIRKARTGRKKQAPEVNADKFLPGGKKESTKKKASGGIAGYATGGEVAALYESVLGRPADAAGAAYWANSGLSTAEIAQALASSPEARSNPTIMGNQVQQIFNQQLGRGAEQTAVDFYSKALASGQSLADVSKGIAQSLEGQKLDKQGITSVFRQVLGRNPEPAGQQYWLSVAQSEGLTTDQLKDRITSAANVEREARKLAPDEKFTQMQLDALGSDPFGGYYSEKSIYDIAPDAKNVSMIGNRQVQFATPVTQQAVVSKFIDGVYTANPGVDIVNEPHIQAAINVARANGTLTEAAFNNITAGLKTAKTPAETRAVLAAPQASVIVDALYGQQIGENANLDAAKAEAAQRQGVLSGQDPGYYQSNKVLTDAYKAAGVSVPFEYDFYKDVDTRDRASNVVTPENFQQKQNSLLNSLNRNNPYRTSYQPLNRGIANMPASVQDPYSDAGLQFLYGQMMNQYAPQPASFVNPATFAPNSPYTYAPPPLNNLVLNTPIPDAARPAPEAPAAPVIATAAPVADAGGGKAGGLMSVDRKKRAKTKPKKGLLAA